MKIAYTTFLLLGIAVESMPVAINPWPPFLSRVRIDITDSYGKSVESASGVLYNNSRKIPIHQNEVLTLPSGEYTAEVSVPGFDRLTRSIIIDQPEQVASLALPFGGVETPRDTCSIRGKTNVNFKTGRVRLVSLFGNQIEDVSVQKDGGFLFKNLECGDYLLFAVEKDRCTEVRQIRTSLEHQKFEFYIKQTNCIQIEGKSQPKYK